MKNIYKVALEIEFSQDAEYGQAGGYPAGWLEGALEHLFHTFNDDGSPVAVKYQFEGMDQPMEVGVGS